VKKPKILAESVSTFSLSTVPRGAAIVIVEGNSLDASPGWSTPTRQQISVIHLNLLTTVATLRPAIERTRVNSAQ
jgi:hypothetical protein